MTQSKHTPTPWAVTSTLGDIHSQARNGKNWVHVFSGNQDCPSIPDLPEQLANAAFIVKAVNHYDEMLKIISDIHDHGYSGSDYVKTAALLKKIGEE